MNNVIQFNFEQTYKEIEIAGKTYRMEMNDDAQVRIQDLIEKAQGIAKEAADVDTENMTTDELKVMAEQQKKLAVEMVDTFLGDGTGEELYEVAGRSSINLMKLVRQLQTLFEEFMGQSYEDEKKKFTKKGK